jgi:hypothetical protein
MRADILLLRQWLAAPKMNESKAAPTTINPVTIIETLDAVVESVEPALRLFLNYPTQRLLAILLPLVHNAEAFATWLRQTNVESKDPSLALDAYLRSCNRLCTSLIDWHNALILARVTHDLDSRPPELQN